MLDYFASLFKKEFQLSHASAVMNQIAGMVNVFRNDFLRDPSLKNDAIDALCAILQSQKDPVAPVVSAPSQDQVASPTVPQA